MSSSRRSVRSYCSISFAVMVLAAPAAAVAQAGGSDNASGLYAGSEFSVARWSYDVLGSVTNDDDRISFDDGVQSDEASPALLRAGVRFNRWWLPDLAVEASRLKGQVTGDFTTTTTLGLITATGSGSSRGDFDNISLSVHFPIKRDGGLRLGAGVLLEQLDGTLTTSEDGGETTTDDFDQVFPQLSVQAELAPEGAFSFRLEGSLIEFDDDRATRLAVRALWPIIDPLGIELGYLRKTYAFTTQRQAVDVEFRGAYFGVLLKL